MPYVYRFLEHPDGPGSPAVAVAGHAHIFIKCKSLMLKSRNILLHALHKVTTKYMLFG